MSATIVTGPERLVNVALEHAGCSAHKDPEKYKDVIVRPADRTPRKLAYFMGKRPPSTCALFVLGCWRLVEVPDPVLYAPYRIGMAVADVENVARAHSAWLPPRHVTPFSAGDVWVINGPPYGVHVGLCVADAVEQPDGSWRVETVEGGQAPDSSGIVAFRGEKARHFVWSGTKLMLGTRALFGVVAVHALGIAPQILGPIEGDAESGAAPHVG